MKLEQSFEVKAPVEQVWEALIDLEKVAPCLPGAAITGHDDDGTYHGTFQVKLGPTTANYRGTIRIESADAATRTATLAARGSDKRGQGGASATIVNTLHEVEGGTRVDAVTDFTITGRLASFGRGGMMKDISNRLLRDFATCLQQRLAAEPAGALTAEEAAASAGAETAGKTPAEVSGAAAAPESGPAEVGGKSPAEVSGSTSPPPPGRPVPTMPAQSGPAQPPAAAPPVKGFSLLVSVLWERIRGLFRRRS
jgi:carbon monoxide dehydrogenase subunit G